MELALVTCPCRSFLDLFPASTFPHNMPNIQNGLAQYKHITYGLLCLTIRYLLGTCTRDMIHDREGSSVCNLRCSARPMHIYVYIYLPINTVGAPRGEKGESRKRNSEIFPIRCRALYTCHFVPFLKISLISPRPFPVRCLPTSRTWCLYGGCYTCACDSALFC